LTVVGSAATVEEVKGDGTEVIDLEGKFAMPGLIDPHIHLGSFYAASKLEGKLLRFPAGASHDEMQSLLTEYAGQNPGLEVIVAENYNSGLFPGGSPPKEFLDEVVADRPVIAISDTEHEALLNSAALARAGITSETPDPPNGQIIRDPTTGKPAGTMKEAAAGRWGYSEYPAVPHDDHVDGLHALISYLNSVGVTAIKVAHADPAEIAALQDLEAQGELTARTAVGWTWLSPLSPKTREQFEETIERRGRFASSLINPDFVKINIDGTPTGSAYMLEAYEGRDERGQPFIELDELADAVARFDAQGIGVTFHVMGDAGMRLVIDALEEAASRNGGFKARHQLGHSSLIAPEDIERIAALDLSAEFSAPNIHYDVGIVEAVEAAIGPGRYAGWFPVKQVAIAGGRIVTASDGPLFWQDPLEALQKMVLRSYPGGENLTLEEVIESMTINAAFVMDDDTIGSLEPGKQADMIVLDRDIFSLPPEEIGSTKVLRTLLSGKVIFDASIDPATEEAIEVQHDVELETHSESHKSVHFESTTER
jgi:predicted amidohydrolase YtcJ